MATPDVDQTPDIDSVTEETDAVRESWLEVALADMDGGAAALATAARGGLVSPKE